VVEHPTQAAAIIVYSASAIVDDARERLGALPARFGTG